MSTKFSGKTENAKITQLVFAKFMDIKVASKYHIYSFIIKVNCLVNTLTVLLETALLEYLDCHAEMN